MIPFQKIIAWFLIGLLFFEATFRVPFLFPEASALESANHEDIVSLIVEEELFRKMSSDIDAYARRIQSRLSHTRTVILTYARDAHPYLIASGNERLYFSGIPNHGNKTQKLVGTILIGHVPLPVVHKDNKDFLSLYPYTDFDEPHFFWNWDTSRYEYVNQKRNDSRPDIWHSVIDPNTGSLDSDVQKIRDFFARVYEFDAKKGRYENVGANPQVLYMDSVNESRAASKGLLSVYEQIFVPQQEHLLYHRFSREFAQYLYAGFLSLMKSEGTAKISSFRDWTPDANSTSSFLAKASDISTKVFSDELITPFLKVINEKYLGDVNRWVHNTGRYYNGYSDVRVDTMPELITTKDALTGQVIKESNDALEKLIDTYVDNNLALDIPVLVSRPGQKTISERSGERLVSRTYNFTYDNYFYGTKASEITNASQCSLIRGTNFGGKNTTVEANHGFDMSGAKEDSELIKADTNAGIKCISPTQSYWGGNSPMNATYKNGEMLLSTHRYDDFSLPVLDLGAGKKTTGANSPLDCLRNDLILRPYQHNGLENRKYLWPTETGGSRYSCATPLQSPTPNPFFLDPTPETNENILSSLVGCGVNNGNITLLNRNGASLGTCQANGLTGTYKRISSLVKHSDPSTAIYGQQLQGNATPNLPIDEERYLLYIDRTGAQSRIDYPNLFDIPVDLDDSDEEIINKIRSVLNTTQSRLIAPVVLPSNHRWSRLVQPASPSVNLADILLSNNDIKSGLIDALRWKNLDIEMKYSHILRTALKPSASDNKLLLPDKKDLYEISYLGGQGDARNFVFGFNPEAKTELPEWFTDIQESHGDIITTLGTFSSDSNPEYSLSSNEIAQLLGEGSTGTTGSDAGSNSDASSETSGSSDSECGDPTGVVIWEWLSAIQCWLSNLMKTEWFTPDIDDIGFPELPSLTVSFGGDIVWSTKELQDITQADANNNDVTDYVEKNVNDLTLTNTLSSATIEPTQTLRIDTALENETHIINDDSTRIVLEVTRIDDLDEGKSYSAQDSGWSEIQKRYFSVSGGNVLKDGHAVWIFTSKNNHRTRISFESRIYSGSNILLRSERSSVLIGPINLSMTVLSTSGSTTSETITAGDPNGINILLSGLDTYPSTADITLYDYVTGEQKGLYKAVPIIGGRIRLGSPSIDPILRRAGRYTLLAVIGDYSGKTNFTIATSSPHHIDAVLDPLLIKDTPTPLILSLRDEWNNTINAQDWNLQIEGSSSFITVPISSKAERVVSGKMISPLTFTALEAGNVTLNLTASKNSEKISLSLSRPVLSDAYIVVDIPNRSTLEVGQQVPVNFSIQRQDGTLIEDWNMSVKIGIRGGNAQLSQQVLTFVKGRATTTLQTGTRTGTVSLYLQDTGLGKIIGDSFVIAPGTPTSISLSAPETIHAKLNAQDALTAYLYDAYGNLTTLHGYAWKLNVDKPSLLSNTLTFREISTGVYQADIMSSGIPGRLLFRSWLEKDGNKSPIKTLENVALTNALPVITSDEASQNSWHNITQILLGAAFGQSPIQGYFAGATLFASTTKTLALSTLIDAPQNPIFTVTPSGNIITGSLKYGTGIEAQIESYINNVLTLVIYDTRLGGVARVRYPALASDTFMSACSVSCDRDIMYFVPNNNDITYKDSRVYNGSQLLFSLKDIFTFPNLSFAFVHQNSEYLQFLVSYNGLSLGTLHIRWKSRVPVEQGSEDTSGTYTLSSLRSTLSTKLSWSNKSSYETPSLVLYNTDEEITYVGGSHNRGWSAYPEQYGLGWTHNNTSLLQFAAGQEWSNSIRNHADYLTINLGDPIISLPNYQVNSVTGLDQTLGEPVYAGVSDIDDFTFKDANSDGKKDLIVYHPDGTIGMGLLRGDGAVLDVGDLLSVRDAQQDKVRAGDFIGDGYSDIVYIDEEGVIHQVTHSEEGPTEKPMKYDTTPLLGQIEQLEVFDMDHDGIDDIIVMDNLGSLYIFYGQKTGIFTVQLIENVYDFVLSDEAKSSYFTGAISYNGLGFVDPDNIPKSSSFELQSKQDQVNQLLFTQIRIAKKNTTSTTPTISSTVTNTLDVDSNGLLRMYDGDATTLTSSLQFGYDALSDSAGPAATVSTSTESYDTFDLLRAPFIIPGYLSITKQYTSLEQSGQIISGSPIQVTITLKNVSKQNMSNILLLEKFADYLSVSDMGYTLISGAKKETRTFLTDSAQANAGIADLRDITLASGSSITITYTGALRSFSFGRFDVGYLEDKDDPISASNIEKDNIRTINSSALGLASIPEKDFYNHDVYGDIRFNPNETCGGPVLLWRSHNTYDRTYHKTIIVREVANPDEKANDLTQDPTNAFDAEDNSNSSGSSIDIQSAMEESVSTMETWESDSDADDIPDNDDDDHGDVFEVSTSGNTTQISVGLGKMESTIDEITEGVKDILSGLSCGFGDPGCISMPINWTPNAPGNTITLMGYAVPGANTPPVACHKSVLCGTPAFAYPTDCCSSSNYYDLLICEAGGGDSVNTCTWPSAPEGAGGLLDYMYMNSSSSDQSSSSSSNGLNDSPDASGSVTGQAAPKYEKGLGISNYRLWITPTLTGAIAEIMCFGPNNSDSMNLPGLFPLRFDGNCIFATQPLFQCEDDGSGDEPLVVELDIADELSDEMDDGSGDNSNRFTNADECNFFESVTSYPTDLSASADAYFKQTNDATVSALQTSISEHADIVNQSRSTDTALEFSTTSTSPAYERLNGQNGLQYEMNNGTGMIQIALDPSAMKFKDFGKVIDINLKSIKGFPNFIMDWYQRQMDEIMSSLTHLPDLKIFLPDLSALGDSGWMSSFGSGMKQQLGNIFSAPTINNGTNTGNNLGGSTNSDYYNAQDLSNNCGATACSIAASKLTGANAQQLEQQFTAQDPGGMSWSSPQKWLNPLGLGVDQRSSMTAAEINSQVQSGNVVLTSVTPKSGLTTNGHITAITGSQQTSNGYVFQNSDPNYYNIQKGYGTISDSQLANGGAKQFWIVSNDSTSNTGNSGNFITNTANTVKSGWNGAFGGINSGLDTLSSGAGTILGGAENAANSVASVVQQKTAGIQNAFEYLGTLPIIDVHPETISFDIPWVGKQEAQAWIARNQAILDAWKKLPVDAANSVYVGPLIASIESNIETVRSYFELPERLQTLFYLKEKLLYGILQNVKAVQDLMGGWLYENGQRFKGWVEAFILITKLFDLWQILLDVFNDYEVECGECRNERWNLQHWLWIIISAIIPPIPIIEMPRWPDIELDFSDIDLSLDIAYPVFDLNFYPISLPDAPAPTISGFPLNPMPQLPQIPDLNIDIEIPVIQLPNLPDLPPPPKIPELSQAIEVVLDIFKLLVLIQCLYRKIPLSPEWVVGTKVAHKTERQGYLPFDFLDSRLPTVSMEWLEAIRVSSHVKLDYDVDFVIDVLREALAPFTNFPKNLGQISGSSRSNSVDFNINPETGVEVKTSSIISEQSLAQIPDLIQQLFVATSNVSSVDPQNALNLLSQATQKLDINPERKKQLTAILEKPVNAPDFSHIQHNLNSRFDQIAQAVQLDVADNKKDISDLVAWSQEQKKPEDIMFIAQNITGSVHFAESASSTSHLLALAPNILQPTTSPLVNTNIIKPIIAPLSVVAPTPETVVAPNTGNTYQNMVESQKLTKTQGLYVTHGTTTHRLIDYTENLDGETKIHTLDDDGDGDLDVYYSLGNTIYRKENYSSVPTKYIIKDAPQVYTTADIYKDFFDVSAGNISDISSDGQINILQNHSPSRIRYQMLMKQNEGHSRLRLFRSLFKNDAKNARYQIDIIPKNTQSSGLFIQNVPRILDIDGLAFIEHKNIYRTLLTNKKFINEDGREEDLSDDFIIRSGQSGYVSESTTLDISSGSKTVQKKMVAGQRIIFDADSRVVVKKGSLILFGNTTEKRPLSIRDTHLPLLPGDLLITDKNGGITVKFPDGTETEISASQYWTLTEYEPGIGIKKLTLPVETEWYYGSLLDARSSQEARIPHGTVFDAYTDFSEGDVISQMPRQISLSVPGPTEIDFQTYFPADTLTNVEIFRLPSSEWRRVSATKVAFEAQKEKKEILVRVTTTSGRVRDYVTQIMTLPPKLYIDSVDSAGLLTGKITNSSGLVSLGIQSYIDGQSWTLANSFENSGDTFDASITRNATKMSIQQGTSPVVTFDRNTATPVLASNIVLSPSISLGKTMGYSLYDGKNERIRVTYQGQNIAYKQVADALEIMGSGIFVLGSGLRLEPASTNDVNLKGGAYITDTSYRPLITLDASGVTRTLDSNVSWSVKLENNRVVFILSRDRQELGRIILAGDMITHWVK